jgi:alpha-N-arabinofuranosidase
MMQRAPLGDAVWAAAGFHLMQQYPTIDMANMAQTVNVAQCLVKTEGARLCVTPTYHVWEMFGPHKGARFVPVALVCGEHVALPENGTRPALSVSATQDGDELFLSVINFDLRQSVTTTIVVAGSEGWQAGDGRTLTGDSMDAHNTFDDPERVRPRRLDVGSGAVTFAPLSVSTLRLRRTLQQ